RLGNLADRPSHLQHGIRRRAERSELLQKRRVQSAGRGLRRGKRNKKPPSVVKGIGNGVCPQPSLKASAPSLPMRQEQGVADGARRLTGRQKTANRRAFFGRQRGRGVEPRPHVRQETRLIATYDGRKIESRQKRRRQNRLSHGRHHRTAEGNVAS